MPTGLQLSTKEVDVDFLVFVERHATDLLRWDILTFFGHNPNFCDTIPQIAQKMGRRSQSIRPEADDLALLGVLDKTQLEDGQILYRLTQNDHLRRMTQKLAGSRLTNTVANSAGKSD